MRQQTSHPGRRGVPGRRLLLAALLAVAVVLVPGVASARFSRVASTDVSVGTTTVAPPASATVTRTCPFAIFGGSVKVTFPDVPQADGYLVTLVPASGATQAVVVTSGSAGATFDLAKKGSYTVNVVTQRSTWSSSALTRSFTC